MSNDPNAPWGISEILTCFNPAKANVVANHSRLKDLKATVLRKVGKVSIEFLKTNGTKPHVVFNLAIFPQEDANLVLQYGQSTHQAVRVSMEWHGDDDEDTGYFEILPLPYKDSSHSAHGAFDFPLLKKNLTVWDWSRIFMGTYPGLPDPHKDKNLLKFRFVETSAGSIELMDGCRDFICQCFVRLYDFKVVQCHGGGMGVGGRFENFNLLIHRRPELVQRTENRDDFWFFDVIDKNYAKTGRIKITPTPMHRGIFLDPNVRRQEWFTVDPQHRYKLNYVNEGPGGGNGGSGNGGNGGGRGNGGPPGNNGPGGPGNGGSGGGRGNGGGGGHPPQGGQPPAGGSSTGRGQGGAGTSRPTGGIPSVNQLGTVVETRQGGQGLVHRSKPTPNATTAPHGQVATPANARAAPTGTRANPLDSATAVKKHPPRPTVKTQETAVKKPTPGPAVRPPTLKQTTKKKGT